MTIPQRFVLSLPLQVGDYSLTTCERRRISNPDAAYRWCRFCSVGSLPATVRRTRVRKHPRTSDRQNGFLNCSLPSLMPALLACERLSVVAPFLGSLLFRVGCEPPIAARTRQMLRSIHHEEHEGHEEWNEEAVKCESYLCNVTLEGRSEATSLPHLTSLRTSPSTSSSHAFVFFVSFVVKQSHTSVRSLPLDSFSSVTHLSPRNGSALFSWVIGVFSERGERARDCFLQFYSPLSTMRRWTCFLNKSLERNCASAS